LLLTGSLNWPVDFSALDNASIPVRQDFRERIAFGSFPGFACFF
jgi:hypothetical protein